MIRCKHEIQKAFNLKHVARSNLIKLNYDSSCSIKLRDQPHFFNNVNPLSPVIEIPIDSFNEHSSNHTNATKELLNAVTDKVSHLPYVSGINCSASKSLVQISIDRSAFANQVLSVYKTNFDQTIKSNVIPSIRSDQTDVVEFGSPNIAKPFHCGHFRSVILGNFISNLCQFVGHRVHRINYLGDWGTQFGLLALAFERWGDQQKLNQNALNHLMNVYVEGNKQTDLQFRDLAKQYFYKLESENDSHVHQLWKQFRHLSLAEYSKQFDRIGVQFDHVEFESDYRDMEKLKQITHAFSNHFRYDNGAYCYVKSDTNQNIPLIKSDGTSLYLSRDILAAIARHEQYSFDNMLYVVDNAQREHFHNLKSVLKHIDCDWHDRIKQIPYGRINGMSTRKGTVVLLEDILNEAKHLAMESTRQKKTSKLMPEQLEQTADILGLSCLIVNDFKRKRATNYEFDWKAAMEQTGDSGISLQYSYSRLNNLKLNCGFDCNHLNEMDLNAIEWSCIDQPEALDLCYRLSQFDEIIELSYTHMEPKYLIKHLFSLSKSINKAYKVFQVKDQCKSTAQTRLILFHCAQQVFQQEMKILGMNPLNRI